MSAERRQTIVKQRCWSPTAFWSPAAVCLPVLAGRRRSALVAVQPCPRAEREHRRSRRQYAHVFHAPPPAVCVARAFWVLPYGHQRGILLHELGHLALGPGHPGGERAADAEARRRFGVRIRYRDTRWGRRLQEAA